MKLNRREMIRTAATVTSITALSTGGRARAGTVRETSVISLRPHLYHGWPTVARRSSDELLLVCSGGREAHVCPFGWVELMRSHDEGRTWTWPRVLMDGPLDDRDAGVLETRKGSLLVTTFTSVAYEGPLSKAPAESRGSGGAWPEEKMARWQAAHARIPVHRREALLGGWMLRSTDGGDTWSAPYRVPVNSPHGPVQLSDGRLLYPGKQFGHGEGRIGACESADDGKSWRWAGGIPTRPGDSQHDYHELHGIEATDGTLIIQIRNHNDANARETLQSESGDGGRTWSDAPPHRRLGPALAPAPAPGRPAGHDLRAPAPALRQPGPGEHRQRPFLVRTRHAFGGRPLGRPGLPVDGRTERRVAAEHLVREAGEFAPGGSAPGPLVAIAQFSFGAAGAASS